MHKTLYFYAHKNGKYLGSSRSFP